ncbi:hypothetical protein L2E82_15030 [Cichorium intybus]|uniref:Uncharacterized protein n=1 Tax=Cichorium intybus TaxID=13427 RepID=A0ACB9F238_CICIN|nr:hypothetical protein L2E82_15030 [Cichorium intybus]
MRKAFFTHAILLDLAFAHCPGLTPIEEKSLNLNKKKVQSQKQSLKIKSQEAVSCVQGKCRRKADYINKELEI